MKTMAVLALLIASALVASAQSPSVNQPDPPATIRSVSVTGITYTYRGGGGAPDAWHDRFNGPEPQRYYGQGGVVVGPVNYPSSPENFTDNEREFLAYMGRSKAAPVEFSAVKIPFCAAIRNAGSKPIKRVRLQFVFSNPATGAQYPPFEGPIKMRLKPGDEMWLDSVVSARKAPGDLINAVLSCQIRTDVQILRVEYADGSVWDRP
ncbi:MAG TPA: hypothetical protein VJZ91_01300 [Blastocatellia bacterium]|nr:hypothetical protein [Blastocatellia bacterium]